jgi:spectinomycin phosphotransferase
MLVEPGLDRAVLVAALVGGYGLDAPTLSFVPAGETSWCYRVADGRGRRWFLKLSPSEAVEPARAELALRLADALADLSLAAPRPHPTRSGRLWCPVEGLRMAVFELVDGEPLGDQDLANAAVAQGVARLVAAIHAATPALRVPVPFTETFEVWADGLGLGLDRLGRDIGGADPLTATARELVWPQRAALLAMLERVRSLGDAARSTGAARVLCHGDLIVDNLLLDRGGRLWVVDWEAAVLAPRELDLALFTGEGFGRFLAGYQDAAGPQDLDPDLIAFFLLRRNLDDLVDWLGAVLDRDRPDAQRHADLDGLRWCLARWGLLQARIDHARRLLTRRR